ncbi:TPA: hypothetical protein TVK02_000377 [Streptococcus equi subsp. zooepidemicus]|nr:hypothetical protein [Streptococcus equi subsp. zooepidemicus]HEL1132032.1 hypothetical protein [Streptococcus equi subsp. zooepidemicus]HEL1143106.1 hypothetical protein [Streptococcus equi subsp. zooepidemicus]
MANKLTQTTTNKSVGTLLINKVDRPFQISICNQLDNNFCFKDLKVSDLKLFHKFIDETVGKNLSISEVDSLFLRTKGPVKQHRDGRDIVHYGKDRTPFRVHGYFNSDGYFNITRIDPRHKTHKS